MLIIFQIYRPKAPCVKDAIDFLLNIQALDCISPGGLILTIDNTSLITRESSLAGGGHWMIGMPFNLQQKTWYS